MIGGEVSRAALRLATLLVFLSVVTLFFQERSSAGFVVTVMALVVSVVSRVPLPAASRLHQI